MPYLGRGPPRAMKSGASPSPRACRVRTGKAGRAVDGNAAGCGPAGRCGRGRGASSQVREGRRRQPSSRRVDSAKGFAPEAARKLRDRAPTVGDLGSGRRTLPMAAGHDRRAGDCTAAARRFVGDALDVDASKRNEAPPARLARVVPARAAARHAHMNVFTSNQPTMQPTPTPIRPGMMKLWLMTNLPMRVVPERSKPMQARSLA